MMSTFSHWFQHPTSLLPAAAEVRPRHRRGVRQVMRRQMTGTRPVMDCVMVTCCRTAACHWPPAHWHCVISNCSLPAAVSHSPPAHSRSPRSLTTTSAQLAAAWNSHQPQPTSLCNRHAALTSVTHTHTHPFNGPFFGTSQVSRYQKGKTNLDFTEARDSEWQWHQLGHTQVCT